MEELQREIGGAAALLAVGTGTDWPAVRAFFREGTNLSVVLDPTGKKAGEVGAAARGWGTEKLPETYLIDKQGDIRYYFMNKRDWRSPSAIRCLRALADE